MLILNRLKIRQKLILGYVLALGVGIIGTTAGIFAGNRQFYKAIAQKETIDQEMELLADLQGDFLELVLIEKEIIATRDPQAYKNQSFQDQIKKYVVEIDEIGEGFIALKSLADSSPQKDLSNFLQPHQLAISDYLEQVKTLARQLDLLSSDPNGTEKAQQLILKDSGSKITQQFDRFIYELTDYDRKVRELHEEAEALQVKALELKDLIIFEGIVLSAAIAILLALIISRAISNPLQKVTKVAQQVIQDENFDLQAPIETSDEVGQLADSLNHLILKVKQLLAEQKAATELQLFQSEKMSSLGRMLASVAHEINNPANFIYGNLSHATNYIDDLLAVLNAYKTAIPTPPTLVQNKTEEVDLEFLEEDLPKLLQSIKFGAERIRQIVISLKDFSRLDEGKPHPVDLHACLDSTLVLLHGRIKKGITVNLNYGDIPHIDGYAGLLYQVFMNLLTNALDALDELQSQSSEPNQETRSPEVKITTERADNDFVTVRIADNGTGISPENQQSMFEAFFTTKPRGVGTGLGLAISHQIIVEKHGGSITFKSEVGVGTEFMIQLPVQQNSKESNE